MASRVHKRRTGKALRITYEIVAKEEIYEEEDNALPQSWSSQSERKQRTTLSQTDTFIAAYIARTFGIPNLLQQNQAFLASHFTNSVPLRHSMEYDPANNGDATHTLQSEPEIDVLENGISLLEELDAVDSMQAPEGRITNAESYFLDASLFHDATPQGHISSVAPSISDTTTSDSNCSSEMNSEEGDSNAATYSPGLESSVADFDCESFLYFTQNGKVVSYE